MTADKLSGFEEKWGTGLKAAEGIFVGPVKILSGDYAGCSAVNTAIFDSDPCFKQFEESFKELPTVELDLSTLNNVDESATESSEADTSTEGTEETK